VSLIIVASILSCNQPDSGSCPKGKIVPHEILYAGNAYSDSLRDDSLLVIADEDEWYHFLDELAESALSRIAVDFNTEYIITGSYYQSSTCGVSVIDETIYNVEGSVQLTMLIEDISYKCSEVCEAEGKAIVIAAVKGSVTHITVCQQVQGGCEE